MAFGCPDVSACRDRTSLGTAAIASASWSRSTAAITTGSRTARQPCTLLVYVDDATSRIMELRFAQSESTFGYFEATRVPATARQAGGVLQRQALDVSRDPAQGPKARPRPSRSSAGRWPTSTSTSSAPTRHRPRAASSGRTRRCRTGSSRSCACATSARWRPATRSCPSTSRPTTTSSRARRATTSMRTGKLDPRQDLDQIFCCRDERVLGPNLTVQYRGNLYTVTPTSSTKHLAGRSRKIQIHSWADGRMEIHHAGKSLPYVVNDEPRYIAARAAVSTGRASRRSFTTGSLPRTIRHDGTTSPSVSPRKAAQAAPRAPPAPRRGSAAVPSHCQD